MDTLAQINWDALPEDIPTLHRLLREQRQAYEAAYQALEEKYQQLQCQVALLMRRQFGRRSEQHPKAGKQVIPGLPTKQPSEAKGLNGRRPLPADLPRERLVYDVPLPDQYCADCQRALHRLGEVVSEQLDYVPGQLMVKQQVQIKYGCRGCGITLKLADKPDAPITKGLATAQLLAHVLVNKYEDHQPLHRQERMFRRHGIELPRSTLCDWVGACAALLTPLVDVLRQQVLASPRIHTDDTTLPVQVSGKGKTQTGRLWVYIGCAREQAPVTVYAYTPDRRQQYPIDFLRDYRGYLQADAYPGYDTLFKTGHVTEVACWAHVRRKFYEVAVSDPSSTRAEEALVCIGQLYEIEAEAKAMPTTARQQYRQDKSVPLLMAFKEMLDNWEKTLLPKAPLQAAVRYTQKLWSALICYTDDGQLEIDNNRAERAIKPLVLGRRNWTFAGSHAGAEHAATIYSLIETCKAHGVEPYYYLADVLARLPACPIKRVHELLPAQWKNTSSPSVSETRAAKAAA